MPSKNESSWSDSQTLPFVDTLRFWTMASVVFGHCSPFGIMGLPHPLVIQIVETPWKFATIGFFLIAGCLLGNKLETVNPREYLRRRVRRLFRPWTLWFVLTLVVLVFRFHVHNKLAFSFSSQELKLIGVETVFDLFGTAFWFVPDLLLGICVLLMFRRYLYSWKLGAALLTVNLFYAVNIYARWLPSLHAESVFAFVFYLWLGSLASRYRATWMPWLGRIPMSRLALAAGCAAVITFCEARLLTGRAVDPLNVLRVSNQVYALLCLLLLVKAGRPRWSRFIDVRRETFGIYLLHTLVLASMIRLFMVFFHQDGWWRMTPAGLLGLWLLLFLFTYGLSLALTRWLAKSPALSWTVGLGSEQTEPAPGATHLPPAAAIR